MASDVSVMQNEELVALWLPAPYDSTPAAGSILKFHLPWHLCLARLSQSLELLFHMIGERHFRVPDQGGSRKMLAVVAL